MATHISGATRAALDSFAQHEERSLSSALAILLRAGLRSYGVSLPNASGNDPVAGTRSADLVESAA